MLVLWDAVLFRQHRTEELLGGNNENATMGSSLNAHKGELAHLQLNIDGIAFPTWTVYNRTMSLCD